MEGQVDALVERNIEGASDRIKKFCTDVFMLQDNFVKWTDITGAGNGNNLSYSGKVEFLRSVFQGRMKNLDLFYFFDGTSFQKLDEIKNFMNEANLAPDDFENMISDTWLNCSVLKGRKMASDMGGKFITATEPNMDNGIFGIIVFEENVLKHGVRLYRGCNHTSVGMQVSGMLRTTKRPDGGTKTSLIEQTGVTTDPVLEEMVMKLATDPSLEQYERVVQYYHDNGFDELYKAAIVSGLPALKRGRERGESALDTLTGLHVSLIRGVEGISPFVAMSSAIEQAAGYVGSDGCLTVWTLRPNRIATNVPQSSEVLVAGKLLLGEAVAVVPIDWPFDIRDWNRDKALSIAVDIKKVIGQI